MARCKEKFVEESLISMMVIHGVKGIESDSEEGYFFFRGKWIFFADSSFIKEVNYIKPVIKNISTLNKNLRKWLICHGEKK